jgi:redox-sensitive bicupin YhaK (pirin superfamily)
MAEPSEGLSRRELITSAGVGLAACKARPVARAGEDPLIEAISLPGLATPWPTFDPFLFCVHHDDAYPAGNAEQGPAASLVGRNLGQDFEGADGWRMYHGGAVPGFPQHPHRGFETVTVVRRGLIDHSDSLGATARYGAGDAQWLTAGGGIVHAEMFPLVDRLAPNPLELFQIWLNLPRADKLAEPHFSMFWRERIPVVRAEGVEVTVIAGRLGEATPQPPPPSSWAARADSDVSIWSIRLAPGATWTLPAARPGTARTLYFFAGDSLQLGDKPLAKRAALRLRPAEVVLGAPVGAELLLLQGRPIGEPVAQRGPFVMNSGAEIRQAYDDYQRTRFGGWPWPSHEPVHAASEGRFAMHGGKREQAG